MHMPNVHVSYIICAIYTYVCVYMYMPTIAKLHIIVLIGFRAAK